MAWQRGRAAGWASGQPSPRAVSGNNPARAAWCGVAGTGLATRSCCPWSRPDARRADRAPAIPRGAAGGVLVPVPPAGDLLVIHLGESLIPDGFLIAALGASSLPGLQVQADWEAQAFKRFNSWLLS